MGTATLQPYTICHNLYLLLFKIIFFFLVKKVIITRRSVIWPKLAEENPRYIQKHHGEIWIN
jgi:hypothetical protein